MAIKYYKDRDMFFYAFVPKSEYYRMLAEEYEQYYQAQKNIAEERLAILRNHGVEYDIVAKQYISAAKAG